MKVGCLIIDRGDRPEFLEFALKQLKRQTRKPDEILVFNEPPKSDSPDITYRYRMGCTELAKRGCDLIIFTENDDNYSISYVEKMVELWEKNGKPDLIGINHTIYYNILTQKWCYLPHAGHSSAMSMAVTPKINTIKWPDDSYSYLDLHLWKKSGLRGVSVSLEKSICVGIKHGTGLCGGGGHVKDWKRYDQQDEGYKYLSTLVDKEALNFYISLAMKENYQYKKIESLLKKPFLTIITRRMEGKRNELFAENIKSINSLKSVSYEQILIVDDKKQGMLLANTSFQYVKDMINGEWVFLLDDDDRLTDPEFIDVIKQNCNEADVIFFKNKILTGDGDQIYPKPESWKTREPRRGQIGGSCFVVRKWVYDKYIHHFAQSSFGDWHFITEVLKNKSMRLAWVDRLMFETGRVSHGQE